MPKAKISELALALQLNVLVGDWLEGTVESSDIHRPALEMAGYFDHYPANQIQILGKTELEFFTALDEDTQLSRAQGLLEPGPPCLIITRNLPLPASIAQPARVKNVPVLGSSLSTTRLVSRLGHWLDNALAPRKTLHGVFVDLFGIGVLLTGSSGIGKSETALELIKMGHRLIADDAVEIRRPAEDILVGTCPGVLANLLEIRGLGIIDVFKIFGAGAVRPDKRVELILHFEPWREGGSYDRLGFDTQYQELLGVKIPRKVVPVAPGRNLAMLVETAAANFRARSMGVDVGRDLNQRISTEMEKNRNGAN